MKKIKMLQNLKNNLLKKEPISINNLLLNAIIILLVMIVAIITNEESKLLINWISLILALIGTIILKKHFMPFMFLSVTCYLSASTQELWNEKYIYLPITHILWTAGNIFLPIGIVHFFYRLFFKYKIVDYEDED